MVYCSQEMLISWTGMLFVNCFFFLAQFYLFVCLFITCGVHVTVYTVIIKIMASDVYGK